MVEKALDECAGTERAEGITTEGCNQNNQTMVLAIPSYYSTRDQLHDWYWQHLGIGLPDAGPEAVVDTVSH
jgi:hypothetical protein